MKSTITITYTLIWEVDFAPEYRFTKCGKCFNIKRGKEVKQVIVSRCIGYNIRGKFFSLTKLRNNLKKIENLPF